MDQKDQEDWGMSCRMSEFERLSQAFAKKCREVEALRAVMEHQNRHINELEIAYENLKETAFKGIENAQRALKETRENSLKRKPMSPKVP